MAVVSRFGLLMKSKKTEKGEQLFILCFKKNGENKT